MELQTISQVSRQFNISTRTLRYYEQIGLIQPVKKEDFAYRTYDMNTIIRLQQIIVLRKLRIPLRQIADILKSDDTAVAINAFNQNLAEIDDEITALSTIKSIIQTLLKRLHLQNDMLRLLDDESLLEIADSLTVSKINFKEEKTMEDLNKAGEKLRKLTDRDVRIVYLPPMTVAAVHIIGQDENGNHAEYTSAKIADEFMGKSDLQKTYPAARVFGFNNPDGIHDDDPAHGYERWVSVPDDMEVPAPLVKKHLDGGIYAAHVIPVGAWDEGWLPLHGWVESNDRFDFRWETIDGVCGWLEEHLNYWDWNDTKPGKVNQVDLLMPIKPTK